jgi:predicted flap endonuclease-1-like 5' DNA nuclease
MQTFLIGLGLVVAGLVGVFWGYRIFRILLPIYGGVAGFVLVHGWLGESNPLLALIVGIVAAVILGGLAYLMWSVLVGLGGIILGAAIGALIASALNLWTWLAILLVLALAALFGYLFLKIRDEVVIISTVLTGAGAVALGVGTWLGLQLGIGTEAEPNATWLLILVAVIWIGLLVAGIAYQWKRYQHLGWYGFGGRAQPAAAAKVEAPVAAAPMAAAPAPAAAVPAAAATVAAAEVATRAGAEVEIAEDTAGGEVEAAKAAAVAGETAELASPGIEEGIAAEGAAMVPGAALVAAAVAEEPSGAGEAVEEVAAVPAAVEEEVAVPAAAAAGEAVEDAQQVQVEQGLADIESTFPLEEIAKFRQALEFVEGIGPVYAEKLRAIGVLTVLDLLRRGATRKGRAELAELSGITGKLILRWVNHADLYRIKGVGSEYADLLEAAGVDTVVELAVRNPANLLPKMLEVNEAKRLVRKTPVQSQVDDWVAQAKKLPRMVQY